MAAPIRIGMLTPSSNTCLEPVTTAMVGDLGDVVSVHFTRVPVTEISLDGTARKQFGREAMLAAAGLLADADVGVIAWNGTSGSWLGVQADRELCQEIEQRTGVPATTSTLAIVEALHLLRVIRYGLAVPYLEEVADRIAASYAQAGLECVAREHLGTRRNFDFDRVPAGEIRELVRAVAVPGAQAVAVVCTNLRAAPLVEALEAELGLPIVDSTIATLWKCLELAGCAMRPQGWGTLAAQS